MRQQQSSMRNAFSKGTWANYKSQWKTFFAFAEFFQLKPLPASHITLSLYAQLLSRSLSSPDAIRNYVSSLKTLHLLSDLPIAQFDHPQLKFTLSGIKRSLQHTPARASPITPHILSQMIAYLNPTNPSHLVYKALFLTAFFTMARKSNLVPTPHINSPDHFITRQDISLTPTTAIITFRSSKTNQSAARTHSVPLFHIPYSQLCPVTALRQMTTSIPAHPTSPAFTLPNSKPILYSDFNLFTKLITKHIGLDHTTYSTHSFRRGGATHAFQNRVPSELIKLQGDWKSDAYLVYLEYNFEQRISISKTMALNLYKPSNH